jgi:hypothetical protein
LTRPHGPTHTSTPLLLLHCHRLLLPCPSLSLAALLFFSLSSGGRLLPQLSSSPLPLRYISSVGIRKAAGGPLAEFEPHPKPHLSLSPHPAAASSTRSSNPSPSPIKCGEICAPDPVSPPRPPPLLPVRFLELAFQASELGLDWTVPPFSFPPFFL